MTKVTNGISETALALQQIGFGLAAGIIAAALWWLLRLALPPLPVAALVLAALVLADRGRQLGGLAHAAEALGGAHDAESRRRIIADTRLGSFGTAAVVAVLLIQFAALASLGDTWAPPVLLILPVLSAWSRLSRTAAWPLAALLTGIIAYVGALLMAAGTAWTVAALWALVAAAGMLLFGAGTGWLMARYLRRRFGELPPPALDFITARAQVGWLVIAAIVANLI